MFRLNITVTKSKVARVSSNIVFLIIIIIIIVINVTASVV
jgi:hypothetical protein